MGRRVTHSSAGTAARTRGQAGKHAGLRERTGLSIVTWDRVSAKRLSHQLVGGRFTALIHLTFRISKNYLLSYILLVR